MKVLILNGSPKNNGATMYMVNKLVSKLEGDVEVISVYDLEIKPCIDCKYCYKNSMTCSINDDMTKIYKKIIDCDSIVVASPMYFGSFPGPMKNLIDRCQVFWSKKNIHKEQNDRLKKGAVLLNAGSKWEGMFDPMISMMRFFFNSIGAKLSDSICVNEVDKRLIEDNEDLDIKINELADLLNRT